MKDVKSYAICAIKNRFSLAGHLLTGYFGYRVAQNVVELCTHQVDSDLYASNTGLVMATFLSFLSSSTFAFNSLTSYRKTKKHIEDYGSLDERFIKDFSSTYCSKKGLEVASKEKGLDHLL